MTKTSSAPRIAVAIPAGGIGTRFGSRIPKQFLTIQRDPVVTKTVGWFARYPGVTAIAVAAPAAHVERTRRALAALARRVPLVVVPGGPTRQDSVWLAMQAVPDEVEIVVVHDAVRPLVTPRPHRERGARRRRARGRDLRPAHRGDRQARPERRGGSDARSLGAVGGSDAAGVPRRPAPRGAREGAPRRRGRNRRRHAGRAARPRGPRRARARREREDHHAGGSSPGARSPGRR